MWYLRLICRRKRRGNWHRTLPRRLPGFIGPNPSTTLDELPMKF